MTSPGRSESRCQKLRARMEEVRGVFERLELSLEGSLKSRDFSDCYDLQNVIEQLIDELEYRLPIGEKFEVAREIFGNKMYGVEEVQSVFGSGCLSTVPPIPFSKWELEKAYFQNCKLVLRNFENKSDKFWTPVKLVSQYGVAFSDRTRTNLLSFGNPDTDRLAGEELFFLNEKLTPGWVLVSDARMTEGSFADHFGDVVSFLEEDLFPCELPKKLKIPEGYRDQHGDEISFADRENAEMLLPKVVDLLYFKVLGVLSAGSSVREISLLDQIFSRGEFFTATFTQDGQPIRFKYDWQAGFGFDTRTVDHGMRNIFLRSFSMKYLDD